MYKEKDSDSQARVWLVEGNSSRSAQLTGLGKYVLYEIQVLAFTRIGDGSPSHPPVLERTLDDGESPGGDGAACLPHAQPCPSGVIHAPKENHGLRLLCGKLLTEGHLHHCKGM